MTVFNQTVPVNAPTSVAATRRAIKTFTYGARVNDQNVHVLGGVVNDEMRLANVQGDGRAAPDSSYGIWEFATNLIPFGGFESGTGSWTAQVGAARSSAQAKFGSWSLATVTLNTDGVLAYYPIAVTTGLTYTYSAWVFIPTAYDGGSVSIKPGAQTATTVLRTISADMSKRDQWQRIYVTYAVTGSSGTLNQVVFWTGTVPTNGKIVYIDGVQLETNVLATPYIETNGGAANRGGATAGIVLPSQGILDPPRGWVACAYRAGVDGNATGLTGFPTFLSWGTSTSDEMLLMYRNNSGTWQFKIGNSVRSGVTGTPVAGNTYVIVADWNTGTALNRTSVNGSSLSSSGNTLIAQPQLAGKPFYIGINSPNCNGQAIEGDLFWWACGTGTLSDADATTINGWGATDPTMAQLQALNGGAAAPTLLWTAGSAAYILPTALPSMLAKRVNKPVTFSSPSAAVTVRLVGKNVAVNAASGISLVRALGKTIAANAPSNVSIVRQAGRALAATVGSAASLVRSTSKVLPVDAPSAPSLTKAVGKAVAANGPSSASIARSVGKAIMAGASTGASLTKTVGKVIAAAAVSLPSVARSVGKVIAALIASVASVASHLLHQEYGTVTLTDRAVTSITLTDQAVTIATMADAAVTTVALTDTLV